MYLLWYRHPKHEDATVHSWRLKRIVEKTEANAEYEDYLQQDFDVALYDGEYPLKKRVVAVRPRKKRIIRA